MKAYIRERYGGPEVLKLHEAERPTAKKGEVLVKIKAVSLNPLEWRIMRADPFFIRADRGLFKPKDAILGSDFSGIVEEVGEGVKGYEKGDEVFGDAFLGCFAEYNTVSTDRLTLKPSSMSFETGACIGVAGLTAIQAVRDHGKVQKGDKVLISGASGGVGHYCVQMAANLGAEVTAICSSKNEGFVRELGANHHIDYATTQLESLDKTFDVVLDVYGGMGHKTIKHLTKGSGRGVMVGFTTMGKMLGIVLRKKFTKTNVTHFTANANSKDLSTMAEWHDQGKMRTHIQEVFSFEDLPKAMELQETKHVRGKLAITI